MHGTAHWMAFSALFMGGTVIIPAEHHLDPIALWRLVEREQDELHRHRRRRVRASVARRVGHPRRTRTRRLVPAGRVVGRRGPLTVPQARVHRALPALLVVDGYGASETGGQGNRSWWPAARCRPPALPGRRRHPGARPRSPTGRRRCRRPARTARPFPSATTKTRRSRPRPFRLSTACAGQCPGITPWSRPTARSRCSGGARSRSTPAARRSIRKRSSRC